MDSSYSRIKMKITEGRHLTDAVQGIHAGAERPLLLTIHTR